MKRLIVSIMSLALLVGLTACNTPKLEPGGSYAPVGEQGQQLIQPQLDLFVADSAFKVAYQTADLAFGFERDNRALLKSISPQIKKTMDEIRPQALACRNAYAKARKAYLDNPTPAGLDRLNSIIAKIQQLSLTAQAVLPKGK